MEYYSRGFPGGGKHGPGKADRYNGAGHSRGFVSAVSDWTFGTDRQRVEQGYARKRLCITVCFAAGFVRSGWALSLFAVRHIGHTPARPVFVFRSFVRIHVRPDHTHGGRLRVGCRIGTRSAQHSHTGAARHAARSHARLHSTACLGTDSSASNIGWGRHQALNGACISA